MRRELALIALLLSGCSHPPAALNRVATRKPPPATTRPVRAYEIDGTLSEADLRSIEALVRGLTKDPIMKMTVDDLGTVEVMTGVVRGPLDGGGDFYDFAKREGRWVRINSDKIKSWVS
jgi:hypothetical protein